MNEMTRISAQPAYSDGTPPAERKPQLFIDGEWVDSSHGATIPVIDPSTGREIARIVDASDAEFDRAVAAARTAFDDGRWTGLPPIVREGMITRLADLLEANPDEFAELEAIDNGKPKAASAGYDVPSADRHAALHGRLGDQVGGEHIEPSAVPVGAVHAYVRREPVGVAAQIVPWNFPLMMAVLKIAPALAAGCTVVLKPAEQTSVTALRLADLINEAGFPGRGQHRHRQRPHRRRPAGPPSRRRQDRLHRLDRGRQADQPDRDRHAEAGDARARRQVAGRRPARRRHRRDRGRRRRRDLLQLRPGLRRRLAALRAPGHLRQTDRGRRRGGRAGQVGPSLAPDTMMGPLVSTEQQDRVMDYIDQGKKAGASIVTGGDAPAATAISSTRPSWST